MLSEEAEHIVIQYLEVKCDRGRVAALAHSLGQNGFVWEVSPPQHLGFHRFLCTWQTLSIFGQQSQQLTRSYIFSIGIIDSGSQRYV